MASTYTTSAALTAIVGATRLVTLTDRDRNGVADTGVLDAAISEAGDIIDGRLAQRYGTGSPLFPLVTADPATPGMIQRIAARMVLWLLYTEIEPEGRDARAHFAIADTLLTGLEERKFDVDVARADASEGGVIAIYEAEEPTFAGLDENDQNRLTGI
jgi:phage gp36-like protein